MSDPNITCSHSVPVGQQCRACDAEERRAEMISDPLWDERNMGEDPYWHYPPDFVKEA